jgi:hypothetical protein
MRGLLGGQYTADREIGKEKHLTKMDVMSGFFSQDYHAIIIHTSKSCTNNPCGLIVFSNPIKKKKNKKKSETAYCLIESKLIHMYLPIMTTFKRSSIYYIYI